jgi:plasmid stability protein
MAQILVRDIGERDVARLKRRAKSNGRSLQGEAKDILVRAARQFTPAEAARVSEGWHRRLKGRITGDSTDIIRADRQR